MAKEQGPWAEAYVSENGEVLFIKVKVDVLQNAMRMNPRDDSYAHYKVTDAALRSASAAGASLSASSAATALTARGVGWPTPRTRPFARMGKRADLFVETEFRSKNCGD